MEISVKPVKASGTRWISHKVNAMKLCLFKWGLYIEHLENMMNDKSVLAKDRAKIKGYLKDRSKAEIPKYFIYLLCIASRLSLASQSEKDRPSVCIRSPGES